MLLEAGIEVAFSKICIISLALSGHDWVAVGSLPHATPRLDTASCQDQNARLGLHLQNLQSLEDGRQHIASLWAGGLQ